MRLVKLVRSKVGAPDDKVVYRHLSSAELKIALRKKLIEEATEYLLEPSIDELIDVLEVVHALAYVDQKIRPVDLESEAMRVRKKKGGFYEGLGMYVKRPSGVWK